MLALTQAQVNKLAKAYQSSTGMTIKMSKTQQEHNAKVEGTILSVLATAGKFLLSSVLPSLNRGALTVIGAAAGSKVIDKISGSAIYIKKGGSVCNMVLDLSSNIPEGIGNNG